MTRVVLAILLCTSFNSVWASKALTFLNWEAYLADSVVRRYERETGYTISVIVFDSDQERDKILSSDTRKPTDLVMIDGQAAKAMGERYLLPISEYVNENTLQQIPKALRQSCGDWGVPYSSGTTGIVYRSDVLDEPPSSWWDLLRPQKEISGRIAMHIDTYDSLLVPLKALGYSTNTENISELREAHALLLKQKQHVAKYGYIVSHPFDEVVMALAYSGDQYVLNEKTDGAPWKYVVPKEGTSIWVDCIGVSNKSKNKKVAGDFINFLSRPSIAAENGNALGLHVANIGAIAMVEARYLTDESLYPKQHILDKSEPYLIPTSDLVSLRNRILRHVQK